MLIFSFFEEISAETPAARKEFENVQRAEPEGYFQILENFQIDAGQGIV